MTKKFCENKRTFRKKELGEVMKIRKINQILDSKKEKKRKSVENTRKQI